MPSRRPAAQRLGQHDARGHVAIGDAPAQIVGRTRIGVGFYLVLALIARMSLDARQATAQCRISNKQERNDGDDFVRIEYLASIAGISWFWAHGGRLLRLR